MREVLKSAWEAALERERARLRDLDIDEKSNGKEDAGADTAGGRPESRMSIVSSIAEATWLEEKEKLEEQEREKEMRKRLILAMDSARNLDIDVEVLGLGEAGNSLEDDEDSDSEGIQNPFEWDRCLPDQMIVFTLDDLPTLFDVVITTIKPTRRRKYRVIPANVLFLAARFAHHWGTPELLEELVIGAMERIEAAVHVCTTHSPTSYASREIADSSLPPVASTGRHDELCLLALQHSPLPVLPSERTVTGAFNGKLPTPPLRPDQRDLRLRDPRCGTTDRPGTGGCDART